MLLVSPGDRETIRRKFWWNSQKFFASRGKNGRRRKKTGENANLFPTIGTGCAFCPPRAIRSAVFSRGGFVNTGNAFFTQPRKPVPAENPCGKLTVFHILHSFFHSRFSTTPQACGEIQNVDIKYLQFDTLFFTFAENGQFATASRFVENYPLDKGTSRMPDPGEAAVLPFLPSRKIFKKGLILLRFSAIIQHCMKYCCEEV